MLHTARGQALPEQRQQAINRAAVTDDYALEEASGRRNTGGGSDVENSKGGFHCPTVLPFVNQAPLESRVWAHGGTVKALCPASSQPTGEKSERKPPYLPLNRFWGPCQTLTHHMGGPLH